MSLEFAAMLGLFVIAFLIRMPLAHGMIAAGIVYMWLAGQDLGNVAQVIMGGYYSKFVLLAVPMFIFSAQIMNHSTVTEHIFGFAHALVGRMRGGLAQVDVVASVIFSGMSGSAIADASGTGLMVTKAQIDGGYRPSFACAATCASSTIGPIIPPSIPMVIYAYVAGTSVGMLFAAGILPGLFLAFALMVVIGIIAKRQSFPRPGWHGFAALLSRFLRALPALLTVVVLLGGIYSGIFTPTEAAAVAALYALLLAFIVYRSMNPREFWTMFTLVLRQTASVTLIIGGALLISYAVASEGLARTLASSILGVTENPVLLLLLITVIFLLMGMFLDTIVLLLVMVPIVMPALSAVGVDPVHFGVVITLNMMIGLSTPPMGMLLLIMSNLTKTPLRDVIRDTIPFVAVMLVVLVVLVLIPDLSLWLPRQLGYTG
jgi:tripartite ATP-independent transporter DctM subunit